jgi:hypothetical protein
MSPWASKLRGQVSGGEWGKVTRRPWAASPEPGGPMDGFVLDRTGTAVCE